jgi:hypothetical protein
VSGEKQPGVKIDADVWENFREEVRERHGVVRGHLKTELENALRQYSGDSGSTAIDIERRLARVEAEVGVEATDGGTDISNEAECTHTPEQALDAPDERPHPQAATKQKVLWLADRVLDAESVAQNELSMTSADTVRDVIQEEYDFKDDTAEDYIEKVTEALGLVNHPFNEVLFVTDDKHDELVKSRREQERENARDRTEEL